MSISTFKVVFIGDPHVGKTSILKQLVCNEFPASYSATIGVDFVTKTIFFDGDSVRLQLWDTAGQERFRSLVPTYVRKASAALIVFDISKAPSSLERWAQYLLDECSSKQTLMYIVANKIDLPADQIHSDSIIIGKRTAQKFDASIYYTSGKTGDGITRLFTAIGRDLIKKFPRQETAPSSAQQIKLLAADGASKTEDNCMCTQ